MSKNKGFPLGANVCVMQTAAVRLLRAHELSDFAFAAQNR